MSTEIAQSYDIDDTLVRRIFHVQAGAIKRHLTHKPRILIPSLTDIPQFNREVVDVPLEGIVEKASFKFHSGRWVYPHVPGVLAQRKAEGIHIYGNTGRSNKREWVEMTKRTLSDGGIADYFEEEGIFYKPEGVSTLFSKLDAIRTLREKYGKVEHFDDNPADAIPIAVLFPDVEVYIINYASTGVLFSRKNLEYSNVHRIAMVGAEISI